MTPFGDSCPIWENEELTEEPPFKNALKKSIGKTLQLAIFPKLDMGHHSGHLPETDDYLPFS
jgi:hypothetical protein